MLGLIDQNVHCNGEIEEHDFFRSTHFLLEPFSDLTI